MDAENVIPITIRLPESIKAARTLGEGAAGFRMEPVTVLLGPFGVFVLMVIHSLGSLI
jgi:hypothetical protein